MIIREITPEDIEIIARMRIQMLDEVTTAPLPETLENQIRRFVWRHMRDKTCLGVVAEKDGKVIADAVIYMFETMPDEVNVKGLTAMLYNVYTLPEFRGQGGRRGGTEDDGREEGHPPVRADGLPRQQRRHEDGAERYIK